MKSHEYLFFAVFCLLISLICFVVGTNSDKNQAAPIPVATASFPRTHSDELVVKYMSPDGNPMEFVYEIPHGRVVLRAHANDVMGKEELRRTTAEVVRLTSSDKPIEIGHSGIFFRFSGGYPIWGPYGTLDRDASTLKCLCFADNVMVANGVINAQGTPAVPQYYPYPKMTTRPFVPLSGIER